MRPTETIAMAKTLTLEEQPGHNDENGWATVGLIGFLDDDMFIHNPWMSPCGRFEVDPYEQYHEWDMDRFIDMTCDAHFIEMNSGADCRRIAAGVIEEILEQRGRVVTYESGGSSFAKPGFHAESEDTIFILEGTGSVADLDNNLVLEFTAGDAVHVPPGVRHAVRADRNSRIVSVGGPCPPDYELLKLSGAGYDPSC